MAQAEVARAESVDEQDPRREGDGEKKPKSRRPANTAFRQQRLKAWQPILTPRSVLPVFFIVGIIFAPIGGLLLWASSEVEELIIDYSKCLQEAPPTSSPPAWIPSENVKAAFKSSKQMTPPSWQKTSYPANDTGICHLSFDIPNEIGPPVFMYYRLDNFYQNHRRYVQSLDLQQLKGMPVSNKSIASGTCDPLTIDEETGKAFYPCGLIANSQFNDTIPSPERVNKGEYFMTNKGIAWESDKQIMKKTQYKPWEVVPPLYWRARYGDNYTWETLPNIHEDEAFMVWMRTAGLPHFSKLARRNDTAPMPAGPYKLDIGYTFPVLKYDGKKSILISTRSVVGGKNPFMGIAYVVVGGLCILLGALFAVAHLVRPRKLGDHTYLTWNNDQPSTATATGRDERFGSNAP